MAKITNSAKLKLTAFPLKGERAWRIDVKDQGQHYIPYKCILGWDPATMEIKVETWMLKQKNIKFKL